MGNPYYTDSLVPLSGGRGISANLRSQFAGIEDAFDAIEHTFMMTIDTNAAASYWIPVPWACDIVQFSSAIDAALVTANAVLTLEIGGTLVTGSTLTITQSGSAAGDYDTAVITALNSVAAGGVIELICNGGPSTAVNAQVLITVKRTA